MTEHQPDLLTITEAAALLRKPVATLRYWRHLGTGPDSFRVGRHVHYLRSAVLDWIEQQAAAGRAGQAAAQSRTPG